MNIVVVSDHAGFTLKEDVKTFLESEGHNVIDCGTYSKESCDYPDYAHPAAGAVESGECAFGVAMCGSGNGICMTLNKHQGIRAALCWTPELAALARQHNNANVLVLPARFIAPEIALEIMDVFLNTEFEGGRHERRVEKIVVR